jgi:hypothetical protein
MDNLEVVPKLCERLDIPLALKLSKLAIEWDSAEWRRLCSTGLLNMLGQARLMAGIIAHLNGERPKLGGLYRAVVFRDGVSFVHHFDHLFDLCESVIEQFDSAQSMPDNTA